MRRGVLRIAYVSEPHDRRRIAYALSRRVGSAVVRNRIKRRLRQVFVTLEGRHEAGEAPFPPGTYLVSASAAAAHLPFDKLVWTAAELLAELDTGPVAARVDEPETEP